VTDVIRKGLTNVGGGCVSIFRRGLLAALWSKLKLNYGDGERT